MTCTYDFLSDSFNRKSFVFYAFFGNYLIPMGIMIYFYIQIIKTVIKYHGEVKRTERINVERGENVVSINRNGLKIGKYFFNNGFYHLVVTSKGLFTCSILASIVPILVSIEIILTSIEPILEKCVHLQV